VEILNQLGELFLAAVPTVIIVFLFYLFMRWSFFTPMQRVLSERHKRAEGARQEAEASRVAVQEKLRAYNEALRKARIEMFAGQEAVRRRVLGERQASVNAARSAAQRDLQESKKSLAAEVEAARAQLEQSSAVLANEIAEAILAGGPSGSGRFTREEAR
jgi:F0F1-type ATP synthase membrane subunit b/b'